MTVAELIEKLQQLPQEVQVLARNVHELESYVTDAYQFNNGPVLIDASDGEEYEA